MTHVPENTSYFSFQLLSEVLTPGEVNSFLVDWRGLTLELFPSIAGPFPTAQSPKADWAATLDLQRGPLGSKGLEVNHYEATDFHLMVPLPLLLIIHSSWSWKDDMWQTHWTHSNSIIRKLSSGWSDDLIWQLKSILQLKQPLPNISINKLTRDRIRKKISLPSMLIIFLL